MLTTITGLLVLAAFVICILSGIGKAPLWVAVLFLAIVHLLAYLPLG